VFTAQKTRTSVYLVSVLGLIVPLHQPFSVGVNAWLKEISFVADFLRRSTFLCFLLLNLLVLSTHVLWAQRTSQLEESAAQLPDAPAPATMVSELQTQLHLTDGVLPLTFEQNREQTEPRVRFGLHYPGYYRLPIDTNAALDQRTRTAKLRGNDRIFIGSTLANGMTFAPAYGQVYREAIRGAHDLEYYGHHIPGAGSIVLRIGQQAHAHPRITSVLRMVQPQF
jgi:hypothetical protein